MMTSEQTWFADDTLSFVIRTEGDPASLAAAVTSAIWSVDRDQPVVRVAAMKSLLAVTEAERHFVLTLFEVFGMAALALAAIGIYGLLAGKVAERTREIGVRAALGASRERILVLTIFDGMRLAAFGLAIGLCGAWIAAQAMRSLLFDITPLDPAAWVSVVVMLMGVSGFACWTPAWRASRVDPAIALRVE
jgi:putative ABC transport system permease protein